MQPIDRSIYPAIFKRKSTRSYRDTPIPEDMLSRLRSFITEAVPLFPSEQIAFEIQPHKGSEMKIAAYAKNEPAALMNLAFMLQQMDLFMQSNGIGALWNATVRAAKKQVRGLPYGICLVFGIAKGQPIRTSISEFERKTSGEISNKPDIPLVEAVRLAPSARNRQPWFLYCEEGCVDFYCRKGGLIDNTLLKGLHWFDIGIAVCHAVLLLQQEGFEPTAVMRSDRADKDGYIYCVSLNY